MNAQKPWRLPVLIAILAAMALVVGTARYGLALFEGSDEEAIGREADKDIIRSYGYYEDPALQEYVTRVGNKVLTKIREPEFEYHFKVVDQEMINAFALPGGYIYVTRGLLATLNSEAALAGVIGHEVGHVIGHHAVRQMKKQIGSALLTLGGLALSEEIRANAGAWLTVSTSLSQQVLLGYGREFEMESDQVGMITAYEAGYDPTGIVKFLESLRVIERKGGHSYHGFAATHPDTVSRIIEAEGKSELLKARDGQTNDFRDRYLDAIEGLRYGKPAWRGQTNPPWVVHIHTVKEGETFLSIAKEVSGDEGMAMETAMLNGMEPGDALAPGTRIKTLLKAKTTNKILRIEEEPKK
ncbi:MAG: M48 family metalloprotease [Nitrospinae bacterium]|nr:M48 family metalloprotease [Nitrospinota bacterium]